MQRACGGSELRGPERSPEAAVSLSQGALGPARGHGADVAFGRGAAWLDVCFHRVTLAAASIVKTKQPWVAGFRGGLGDR